MSKTEFFAATAAVLILACVAGWARFPTRNAITPTATVQIDPFKVMTTAKLSAEHFADFFFVFD